MNSTLIAMVIMSAIVVVGSVIGFLARYHHKMDLEQWTVGGRGFGLILVWLLMAGEVFTTFTFLGASGWAYSKGGPALYIIAYAPLNMVIAFFILPAIWEVGQKHKLQTEADFFQVRYRSKYLAAFVALVGAICLIPYLQIQLTGLGLIMEVASFGSIHRTTGMIVAFALVTGFVLVSGVRGVAWVSILKDLLLLFAAVFIGVAVPYIYFGGIGHMFAALATAKPAHLTMPGSTKNLGHAWFISTVLVNTLGFFMWPQYFAASFTAKSGKVLRRNAVVMPLYCITMPLMLVVGFTALLAMPGLGNGDLSLLMLVRKTFPAWFLGIVGGAGALTAMVPAAIQLLTGATLYAKNLFRPILAPDMTDQQVARLAKLAVVVLALGALFFAIYTSISLVSLLLLGMGGVAQFFPAVVLGLYTKRVSTAGVFAGMVTGLVLAIFLMLTGRDPFYGVNAGFVALCVNFGVTVVVSALTPVRVGGFDEAVPALAISQTSST